MLRSAGLALALVLASGAARAEDELRAATPEEQAALRSAPDEELPRQPKHWPRTNEYRLDLLFASLAGLGGGYVGVGSDQNYTLAAASGAEWLWLIDHDGIVRDHHLIYAPLIRASEDAGAFIAYFTPEGRDAATRLIAEAYPEPRRHQPLIRRFLRLAKNKHHEYFVHQQERRTDDKPVTWLGDPELYKRVRALFLAGRVHVVCGDLAGERSMIGIGDAARKLGVPIRVLYVSNAESFYPLSDESRANMTGLPRDERSLLVRTVMMHGLKPAAGSVWHYQVQSLEDYVAKLKRPHAYPNCRRMVADLLGEAGAEFIDPSGWSRITPELPRWHRSHTPKADVKTTVSTLVPKAAGRRGDHPNR